jgi:hypothetical protein
LTKAVTSADTVGDEDGGEEAKISKELCDAKAAIAQRRPFRSMARPNRFQVVDI